MTKDMTDDINPEVTNRLANIDDDDLRSFLREVVEYERKVLAQSKPHYKAKYRRYAEEHLETVNGGADK